MNGDANQIQRSSAKQWFLRPSAKTSECLHKDDAALDQVGSITAFLRFRADPSTHRIATFQFFAVSAASSFRIILADQLIEHLDLMGHLVRKLHVLDNFGIELFL